MFVNQGKKGVAEKGADIVQCSPIDVFELKRHGTDKLLKRLIFHTRDSLREKLWALYARQRLCRALPHGKDRTVKSLTAKASLPCASPMLHGKGLCRATPHGKDRFFAVC